MDNNNNYKGLMGVNDRGSYPSGGYVNDDPQTGSHYDMYGRDYFETDRKEKSFGMAVLCGLLTFFVSVFLLLSMLVILFAFSIKGVSFSKESLVSPFETTGFGDIKIGSLINDINSESKVRNNITLSEYIYEKLPEPVRRRTSSSEIASVLNGSGAEAVAEFFEKKSREYADVLKGDSVAAAITAKDVIELVEKYKDEAEKILGHEPDQKDYEGIEKFFEDNKVEQTTTLRQGSNNKGLLRFAGTLNFVKNSLIPYSVLAGAICLLLILLLNLEEKRKVLSKLAFCSILTAVIGLIAERCFKFLVGAIFRKGSSAWQLLSSVAGNIRNAILRGVIVFAVLGVVSLIAFIIINESYVRRENNELMERFNDGNYM